MESAITNNNCDHSVENGDVLPTGKESWIDFDGLRRLLIVGNAKLIYSADQQNQNQNHLPTTIEHSLIFLKHLLNNHQNDSKKIVEIINEFYANLIRSTTFLSNSEISIHRSFVIVLALLNNIAIEKKKELGIYEESKKFIKTFEDLVIFCELGRKIATSDIPGAVTEKPKRRGFGRGYRSLVEDFYLPSFGYKEKLIEISKNSHYLGWAHYDLVKICHLGSPKKISSPKSTFLVDFVKGSTIEQLGEKYGSSDTQELRDLYNLSRDIRLLRSGVDATQAVKIIETFPNLSLKHVSEKFYKDKDVAMALIRRLKYRELLNFIGSLTVNEILHDNHLNVAVEKILSIKENKDDSISPSEMLFSWKLYEKNRGVIGRKNDELKKRKQPLKYFADPKIVEALSDAFLLSFKHFAGVGKQFLICVDLRQAMNKHSLNGAKHLTPMNAAACLIMQSLRCESSSICLAYSVPGLVPVDVQAKHTYEEILKRLSETKCGTVSLKLPFTWASEKKKLVDTFLVITTAPPKGKGKEWHKETVAGLAKYNEDNKTSAKAVLCYLKCNKVDLTPFSKNILTVGGWDHRVSDIIWRFSKGDF